MIAEIFTNLLFFLMSALLAGALGGTMASFFAVRSGRATDAGVAKKVQRSVVTVRGNGTVGSGFVFSADGCVLTNDHVIENMGNTMVVWFSDGTSAPATLVGRDKVSDVATIKVARADITPASLGNSDTIAVGDRVLAFGTPETLDNTVTAGIVSAIDRTMELKYPNGVTRYYAAIQTDAAINQGNSGGPLVDAKGNVIGMNSILMMIRSTQGPSVTRTGNLGLGFAIPINQVKRLAMELINHGKARHLGLGARFSRDGGTGARLCSVESGSPAASAGMRVGDTIVRFDGHLIKDSTALIALIRRCAPGTTVSVQYTRRSQTFNAKVTVVAYFH